jgi:Ca-activated chloride channel family protein
MTFLAGDRLWLLAAVAAIAVLYVILQLRRTSVAVRFAELDLLASVAPRRPGWRRHISAAAFLVLLAASTVAFARPVDVTNVTSNQAAVIVALDVSNSMNATDVSPTRLAAAKAGATQFVKDLPANLKVGLVSFYSQVTEDAMPTTDHASVEADIQALTLGPGTAIGDAVETSLAALSANTDGKVPARIVLLSDGGNTIGTSIDQAAQDATAAGVPVSTIAYGTPTGVVTIDGQTIPVPADTTALAELANNSGGKAYTAESATQLRAVYNDIGSKYVSKRMTTEITSRFVGIALLAGLVCAVAALLWTPRLP